LAVVGILAARKGRLAARNRKILEYAQRIGAIGGAWHASAGRDQHVNFSEKTGLKGRWCMDLELNGWGSLQRLIMPWLPCGGGISGVRSQAFDFSQSMAISVS
jgi:hypothetical protein